MTSTAQDRGLWCAVVSAMVSALCDAFSARGQKKNSVLQDVCCLYTLVLLCYKLCSLSSQVLPVLLSKLGSASLDYDLVLEALCHMWTLMADHTSPEHAMCVWRPLLVCTKCCR